MARQPNPYNARAAAVADALRTAAAEGRITTPLASLSRAEARAILQQAGLYSSEGSLSRDLAAIRKALPEFGGSRTRWAGGQTVQLADGSTYRAVRIEQLHGRMWAAVAGVATGGLGGDGLRIRWLDPSYLPRDRAQARAMLASLAPRPARAPAGAEGGGWMKYCIACGMPIPEADDDLCADCRAQLEELRDMADEEERWQTLYDWLLDHGLTPEDAADWADRLLEERGEEDSWLDMWVLLR